VTIIASPIFQSIARLDFRYLCEKKLLGLSLLLFGLPIYTYDGQPLLLCVVCFTRRQSDPAVKSVVCMQTAAVETDKS